MFRKSAILFTKTQLGGYHNSSISHVLKPLRTPFQQSALDAYQKLHFDDTVNENDPEVESIKNGIFNGCRSALARAITLVESRNAHRRAQGHYLLKQIMEYETEKFKKKGYDSLIFRIGEF